MQQIWAIARNLIAEVLRMRILMVFIILLTAAYTGGFAYWLHTSNGLADEKIQTFLSYSLSIALSLLALLTIFISTATITRDIKRREIFTIATKPISRGQFLVGKFLGMAVLNLLFLALIGGAIYGLCWVLQRTETRLDTPADRAAAMRLRELVLVARRAVPAPLPDITREVNQRVDQLVEQKKQQDPEYRTNRALVDAMRNSLTQDVTKQLTMRHRSAPPGHILSWHFSGLQPVDPENGYVFLRFKQEVSSNPADMSVWNQWMVGPEDPLVAGGGGVFPPGKNAIRTVHEFPIPVSEISENGDLYVVYRNPVENTPITVVFPPEDGLEVLYVAGGFETNFLRALLAMYIRLLFLAILGLAVGAWLSFPVAVLFALVVYLMGLSSNFILDAVKWGSSEGYADFIRLIMALLPKLAAYDPVVEIEKGRLVSWHMLASAGGLLLLLKGGLVALVGYLIFRFRELARVIV